MPRTRPAERRTGAIDAFIDLVLEQGSAPRPEEVADRAGVSIATLYRYFANLDELRHGAIARLADRFPDLVSVPRIGDGTRQERITRFVAGRVAQHETLHALELLPRAHGATDPGAAEIVDLARNTMADQIRLHFADELGLLDPGRRDDTVATISAVTSVESWELFRRSQGRTPRQIRRAWVDAVDRLLPAG